MNVSALCGGRVTRGVADGGRGAAGWVWADFRLGREVVGRLPRGSDGWW